MKKLFKIALVTLMALCLGVTNVSAVEEDTVKAIAAIHSGDTTAGVVVDDDYTIYASVEGTYVDASTIEIGVALNNVASLGVEGWKEKTWTYNTGSAHTHVNIQNYIYTPLQNLGGFDVEATVEGLPVTYTFESGVGADSWGMMGTPNDVEAARAAYQEAVSHFAVSTANEANSYATVKAGTYVQIGTERVVVENDGTFDSITFDQNTEDAIRTLLTLEEGLAPANVVFLPAGSSICIGDDVLTLLCDCTITITGDEVDALAEYPYLSDIKEMGTTVDGLLVTLVSYLGDLRSLNGATIGVDVQFACTTTETIVKAPTCTEDGLKTITTSCGKVTEVVLPAAGHNYVDGVCKNCGAAKAPETGDTGVVALYSMMLVLAAAASIVLKKKEA